MPIGIFNGKSSVYIPRVSRYNFGYIYIYFIWWSLRKV